MQRYSFVLSACFADARCRCIVQQEKAFVCSLARKCGLASREEVLASSPYSRDALVEFHDPCEELQVKIVKCLVENIVVDISFNQIGGLCTLCFLEEVCAVLSSHLWFSVMQEASELLFLEIATS
jgi:hypothetical protein